MSDNSNQGINPIAFKVILVGPQGVGKSSILNRLIQTKFNANYMSTIGIDFKVHEVAVGNKKYSLQIWDTAGQQKFKALTSSYYKGSNACICVFDLSNPQTLQKCQYYLEKALGENISNDCIYLLGNKSDLGQQKVQQGKKYAERFNISYCSVSAKEGLGLVETFNNLTVRLAQKCKPQQNTNIKLNRPNVVINDSSSKCKC